MPEPKPLSAEEQANIEWGLSCSTGGLDADGVREYMAPWIATVNDLRATLRAAEDRLRRFETAMCANSDPKCGCKTCEDLTRVLSEETPMTYGERV